MALREISCRYPQACPRQLWVTTTPNGSLGRHWSFASVIHLITNDDWRNMLRSSIIDLSPPTLPRIGFSPPSFGGFFLAKISVSTEMTARRVRRWPTSTASSRLATACRSGLGAEWTAWGGAHHSWRPAAVRSARTAQSFGQLNSSSRFDRLDTVRPNDSPSLASSALASYLRYRGCRKLGTHRGHAEPRRQPDSPPVRCGHGIKPPVADGEVVQDLEFVIVSGYLCLFD